MSDPFTFNDEIEDSLRICDELLDLHPDFVSDKPDLSFLDDLPLSGSTHIEKTPEPKVEVKPEPKVEVKPEPKVEVKPEPKVEVKPEPKVEVKPEPKVEVNPEPKVEVKPEPKVEVKPEPKVEVIKPEPLSFEPSDTKKSVPFAKQAKAEKKRGPKFIVSIAICVVMAVAVAFLITKFVASHTTVQGGSMQPTLNNGDELIVEKVSYLFGEPERFDVIIFEYDQEVNYVKRVIGLPGEKIQIKDQKIYINGRALFDKYGSGKIKDAGLANKEITLGADEYFVLGDNRNASKDSRDSEVGNVKADKIVGRAWVRVLPFSQSGVLK